MLIDKEEIPQEKKENVNALLQRGHSAPFGRRPFDDVLSKKPKNTWKRWKFWSLFLFLPTFGVLTLILPSSRVYRHSARAMDFALGEVRTEGGKIVIPPLIFKFSSLPRTVSENFRASPIQILSFMESTIPAGTEGRAVLITGATNGLIKARLTESVRVDGISALDSGALLLGQGRSTEERLFVDFKKAVLKDGKTIPISAQAFDVGDSILGLKGSRVGDMSLKLAATAGLNFISGMALGLETPNYDQAGKPIRPSAGSAAMSGISQAAGEQAKSFLEETKNRQPVIEVKAGTSLIVTFDGGEQ